MSRPAACLHTQNPPFHIPSPIATNTCTPARCPLPACLPVCLQSTVAKLLGARGIRSAFETIGIIIVLFTLSWPLALVLLVSAPLLTPLIAQLSARIGVASKAAQGAAGEVSGAAGEVVENMRVVKLFAQQQRELTRFQGLLDGAHQLALKVGWVAGWLGGWVLG